MEQKDLEWELEEGIPQLEDPFIQQYLKGRDSLISEEQKQRHDANFRKALTPMAARACKIVSRIRDQEYRQMVGKHRDRLDDSSSPAETSRLWKAVQKLPKGSLLHVYLHAAVDIDFIINEALATPGLHICASQPLAQKEDYKSSPFQFSYSTRRTSESEAQPNIWTGTYNPGDLVPVSRAASLFPDGGETGFRCWLQQRCTNTHEPGHSARNDETATLPEVSLPILNSLLSYEPILRSCLRRIYKQLAADNIRYVEFRTVFSAPFTLEGANTPEDGYTAWCRVFQEEVEQFKRTDEGQIFHGARVIWTTPRSLPTKRFVQNMQECVLAKLDVPGVICGYDIAGPADQGKPLVELTPLLFYFRKLCAEEGVVIPFLFHAGANLGDGGDGVDHDLFDAMLLGTRRMGQGSSLHQHPLLVDLVKEKKILIESCLRSHPIADSVQSHPLPALLSRGVPVALCSDTPGVYGQNANTLTPEYWTALHGFECLGLTGIAMMMENSIRWSCYDDQSPSEWLSGIREGVTGNGVKASRLREWYEEFEKFCEWILDEFDEVVSDD